MGRSFFILSLAVLLNAIFPNFSYSQNSPQTPYKVEGACPFECCVYTLWEADKKLTVYSKERDTTDIAFTIEKGTKFKAITGNLYVNSPGKVVAKKSFIISELSPEWKVQQSDTLYLLNYLGEGFYRVWYKGKISEDISDRYWYNRNINEPDDTEFAKLISNQSGAWWAKIKNSENKSGWLYMKKAKVTGPDACR